VGFRIKDEIAYAIYTAPNPAAVRSVAGVGLVHHPPSSGNAEIRRTEERPCGRNLGAPSERKEGKLSGAFAAA
jgi:hypothetical protein